MQKLLDSVLQTFRDRHIREVYPSFDAVPVSKKSTGLFTVIALDSVQLDFPFPDGYCGVHPFCASFRVSVLIPMTAPVSRAEEFFYNSVFPLMQRCGSVLCEVQPPHVDIKLQRVVMSGVFRMKGVYAGEPELPEISVDAENTEVIA